MGIVIWVMGLARDEVRPWEMGWEGAVARERGCAWVLAKERG
jgi:hypothetical protein